MNQNQKEKDDLGMTWAWKAAKMSSDPSSQVGAVLTESHSGKHVHSFYNRLPSALPAGLPAREELWKNRELKNKYILHAEHQAAMSALLVIKPQNLTLYGNWAACMNCAKSIYMARERINRVVVDADCLYAHPAWSAEIEESLAFLESSGIEVSRYAYQGPRFGVLVGGSVMPDGDRA